MTNSEFYKIVTDKGFYSKPNRLRFYLENQLFKGIDFNGKSLIDIGGGTGLFGFYAAINGASQVVVMEPEIDGSSNGVIMGFNEINSLLGNLTNIQHTKEVLENYDRKDKQFDYILMHNSINHIDEEACIILRKDKGAQEKYYEFFKKIAEISHPDTILIICDCARNNLFGDIGLKNPFSPSIEWHKHQNPKFWSELLSLVGFKELFIGWTSPNVLGNIGRILLKNQLGAYLTISHFKLVLKRVISN
jgi:hypothetical protein